MSLRQILLLIFAHQAVMAMWFSPYRWLQGTRYTALPESTPNPVSHNAADGIRYAAVGDRDLDNSDTDMETSDTDIETSDTDVDTNVTDVETTATDVDISDTDVDDCENSDNNNDNTLNSHRRSVSNPDNGNNGSNDDISNNRQVRCPLPHNATDKGNRNGSDEDDSSDEIDSDDEQPYLYFLNNDEKNDPVPVTEALEAMDSDSDESSEESNGYAPLLRSDSDPEVDLEVFRRQAQSGTNPFRNNLLLQYIGGI